MKNIFLLIVYCTLATHSWAQIQNGLVRLQNSGKKPVAGVQIIFTDAVPTTSDQNGKFRLAFQEKKPGDLIFYNEVYKKGYAIVNEKDLQVLKISSTDRLVEDIILAEASTLEAAKKEYYEISDKALLAGFEKEKKALRDKLQQAQLTQQDYIDKLQVLQDQYDNQQKQLDQLADKFARVNFDDVSELYKEALDLFKAGKIEEAIKKLESANLIPRTNQRIKERERIKKAKQELVQQEVDNEKGIKEDVRSIQLQAQLYVLDGKIDKAEVLYDQLLQIDSTNLTILQEATYFYRDNFLFEKAMQLCPKIIAHTEAEDWQKAEAHKTMGDGCYMTGRMSDALNGYTAYNETYSILHKRDSINLFYKEKLSDSYQELGKYQFTLGNYPQGEPFLNEALKLSEELTKDYPENEHFKYQLTGSYFWLGVFNEFSNNLDEALQYFEKDYYITKQFNEKYPHDKKYKTGLSVIYSYFGNIYDRKGDLGKALTYYQDAYKLKKEIYEKEPQNVVNKDHLVGSSLSLASINLSIKNIEQALYFSEECNRLAEEIFNAHPNNLSFKSGLASSYNNLGRVHRFIDSLDKALFYFEKGYNLLQQLHKSHPQYISFKRGLEISCYDITAMYNTIGDLSKALPFIEQAMELIPQLRTSYPQDVNYINKSSWYNSMIASYYSSKKDYEKAYQYSQKQLQTNVDGLNKFPEGQYWKSEIASAYGGIAWYALFSRKFEEAENYALEGLKTDSSQIWINTNLALAYLYQGKWKEAKAIYLRLKDQPYNDSTYKTPFLSDLNELEAVGITHPDVKKARVLLKATK